MSQNNSLILRFYEKNLFIRTYTILYLWN